MVLKWEQAQAQEEGPRAPTTPTAPKHVPRRLKMSSQPWKLAARLRAPSRRRKATSATLAAAAACLLLPQVVLVEVGWELPLPQELQEPQVEAAAVEVGQEQRSTW